MLGALAATYASVPLYKVFCARTGFGGTVQRRDLPPGKEEESGPPSAEKEESRGKSGETAARARSTTGEDGKRQEDWLTGLLARIYDSSALFARDSSPHGGAPGPNRVGTTWSDPKLSKSLSDLAAVPGGRPLTVTFSSSVSSSCPLKFTPSQNRVTVVAGETALAFYTCKNLSPTTITAVSTYNVYPNAAGRHFAKVQCFCFEEQRIRGGEEVDLPVLFYIDPKFYEDRGLESVNNITLNYTFFKTGEEIPGANEDDDDDDDEKGGGDKNKKLGH